MQSNFCDRAYMYPHSYMYMFYTVCVHVLVTRSWAMDEWLTIACTCLLVHVYMYLQCIQWLYTVHCIYVIDPGISSPSFSQWLRQVVWSLWQSSYETRGTFQKLSSQRRVQQWLCWHHTVSEEDCHNNICSRTSLHVHVYTPLGSYPGSQLIAQGRRKESLVYIACACTNYHTRSNLSDSKK